MLFLKAMPSFAQMFGLQLMPLPLVPILNGAYGSICVIAGRWLMLHHPVN
jgi:hypothetical protein